ncbi:MAG: twin-arginine translocase TatA/TatE family subunit [Gemmataceae bacterium]|nr:twin-arginine translocase TatA/TatE family subunit [Gemmataceae bacterium]
MFGLGFAEIGIILIIALFLWGNKLPEMMRWLGKSAAEFKKEANSLTDDLRSGAK